MNKHYLLDNIAIAEAFYILEVFLIILNNKCFSNKMPFY